MDALIEFIGDFKNIGTNNIPAETLKVAHDFQRKAQFYLDFVEAENSMGFHAPQEAVRILGESINFSRKGQNSLRGLVKAKDTAGVDTIERPIASAE